MNQLAYTLQPLGTIFGWVLILIVEIIRLYIASFGDKIIMMTIIMMIKIQKYNINIITATVITKTITIAITTTKLVI